MIDRREARPRCQIILESFHALGRTFRECFDSSVVKILHIPNYLVARGGTLGEEPKAYTLHITAHEKPARYSGHLDLSSI
jgi:hypothetical protein